MSNKTQEHSHTVSETIKSAIDGSDEPMEIAHPIATGALVMGSYPIVLAVVIAAALAYFAFFAPSQNDDNHHRDSRPTINETNR